MLEVVLWDKQSLINGCEAEVVFNSYPWSKTEDTILVKKGDQVQCVERVGIIRSNLGLGTDTTTQEVMDALAKARQAEEAAQAAQVQQA